MFISLVYWLLDLGLIWFVLVVVFALFFLLFLLCLNDSLSKPNLAETSEDRVWWYISGCP